MKICKNTEVVLSGRHKNFSTLIYTHQICIDEHKDICQ